MDIRVIHLGGEVIIARVVNETDDMVTVEKPLTVYPNPQQGGLIFAPPLWVMMTGEIKFDLRKSTLILLTSASSSIEGDYLSSTSEIAANMRNAKEAAAGGNTERKQSPIIIT